MKTKINRRDFILNTTKVGISGCVLLSCPRAIANFVILNDSDEIPDPKKLNYCGYQCPENCEFLKATLENNIELKKLVYENWKIKEQYGIEFEPEKIFCYTCKPDSKPEGIVVANCKVKECALSKGLDCCIECDEITECKKELWERFPDFKKHVIEMQKKYQGNIG